MPTVVRSSLGHPLIGSYETIGELKEDIGRQLNLSGSVGHIYVYEITDELGAEEIFHSSFDAEFIERL